MIANKVNCSQQVTYHLDGAALLIQATANSLLLYMCNVYIESVLTSGSLLQVSENTGSSRNQSTWSYVHIEMSGMWVIAPELYIASASYDLYYCF